VRSALGTDDVDRMRAAKDALQEAMLKVGQQIYAAAGASAGGAGGGSSEGGAPQDDTVEGEFKEEQ
jgi:hypothetical protein